MQQCQNHWQARPILQCAQSRRSGRKQEKLRAKSGKLRCRCGFARTQAFKHAWRGIFCKARSDSQHDCLDMFTKRDTETEPHRHTDTRTQAVFVTASAGIVRVRVAKVFWATAQLPHASLSVQCKRPQHGVESGLLSEPLS